MSEDNDDVWGSKKGPPSAFANPSVLEAESGDGDLGHGDSTDFTAEQDHAEHAGEPSFQAASKGPNVAILALAVLLVIGVVAGAGFVVKQKFFSSKPAVQERIAVSEPSVEVPGQPGGSVFDAPSTKSGSSVFEQSAEKAIPLNPMDASATAVVLPPSSAASAPATVLPSAATTVAQGASPTVVVVPAKTEVVVATPPVKPYMAPVIETKVAEKPAEVVAPVKEVVVAAKAPPKPKAKLAVKTVVDKAAQSETIKTARKSTKRARTQLAKAPRETRVARSTSTLRGRAAARAKLATTSAETGEETIVLNRGLKVQSIYPQSGPNAQAWVTDANGKTEVVRVGDSLRNGPMVTAIVGEKGQVVTTSGVITTRGVR